MTRLVFLFAPAAAVVGVLIGAAGDGNLVSLVLGVVVGLVAAAVVWGISRDRTLALSRAVNAWMGKVEVDPVELDGGPDQRELATALNALGAAYGRRGQRLEQAGPNVVELIAALPEPAVLFTSDGVVAAMNTAARDVLGAAEEGRQSAVQALGSAALVDLVQRQLDEGTGGKPIEVALGRRTVEARATTFAGHALLLVRDLTEARRIAAVRRDFVTNASHELKTPVAGIQSLADALDVVLDKDTTKARQLLGRLRGEADRLSTLVGDLLALRRVDDRPGEEAAEVLSVERFAAEALAGATVTADERGIDVGLEVQDDLRVHCVADDLRLVLANLVDNAVKYNTEGGALEVTAVALGDEQVRIDVRDTGIGIPSADLDRVFERFYRVDPGRSREAGGTGLGLSIVRHAVERNGGEISVSSLVGQGTTFSVLLPRA